MNWKTIYKCPCGETYTNGVGKWDNLFFLTPELCDKCGKGKLGFKRIGVGYWKWKPTLLDWFKGEWIMRDK